MLQKHRKYQCSFLYRHKQTPKYMVFDVQHLTGGWRQQQQQQQQDKEKKNKKKKKKKNNNNNNSNNNNNNKNNKNSNSNIGYQSNQPGANIGHAQREHLLAACTKYNMNGHGDWQMCQHHAPSPLVLLAELHSSGQRRRWSVDTRLWPKHKASMPSSKWQWFDDPAASWTLAETSWKSLLLLDVYMICYNLKVPDLLPISDHSIFFDHTSWSSGISPFCKWNLTTFSQIFEAYVTYYSCAYFCQPG